MQQSRAASDSDREQLIVNTTDKTRIIKWPLQRRAVWMPSPAATGTCRASLGSWIHHHTPHAAVLGNLAWPRPASGSPAGACCSLAIVLCGASFGLLWTRSWETTRLGDDVPGQTGMQQDWNEWLQCTQLREISCTTSSCARSIPLRPFSSTCDHGSTVSCPPTLSALTWVTKPRRMHVVACRRPSAPLQKTAPCTPCVATAIETAVATMMRAREAAPGNLELLSHRQYRNSSVSMVGATCRRVPIMRALAL